MTRVRGSVLVAVLMLLSILFILGLAMLTKQMQAYRGATLMKEGAQAQAAAEAGLEDARVKWEKDYLFPPPGPPEQTSFTYAEELRTAGNVLVATYEVTVDRAYAGPPTWLLRIAVTGTAGNTSKHLLAELDLAPKVRSNPAADNPNLGRFLEVQVYAP